ncbi:MAG: hypothetical protein BRC52_08425, partial [Cyanobacteria bacterium SW_5_48_44]
AVVRAVMPASIVATRIDEMVAAAGCELWYLPPILAYLNKIEPWWFVLKNGISGGMNWSAFAMV